VTKIKPHGEHATVNALAKLLGSTRRTISARIRSSGLKQTGTRRGFAIYQLAAVRALLEVPTDPDQMTGYQRRAHFQAVILERRLIEQVSQSCRREEADQELQRIARILDATLDDLPRRLARKCGLGAEIELKMKGWVSKARAEIRRIEADRQSRWARKGGSAAADADTEETVSEAPDA
jgi:hypothetical protein